MGQNNDNSAKFISNFKNAFNNSVGCGRAFKRQDIADILGVTLSTVENWGNYENDTRPQAEHWERLKHILPPFYKRQIEDFYKETKKGNICHYKILIKVSEFQTDYVKILKDRKVDEHEKKVLIKAIPELIQVLNDSYEDCKK
jgi:hypothetical protein